MNQESPAPEFEPIVGAETDPADRSLVDDVKSLFTDGKTYAEAEFAFQKARVGYAAERGKAIAVYGGLALVFLFFAIMALVVGSLLALAESVGPVLATLIVVGVLLALTFASLLSVRSSMRQVRDAFGDGSDG